MFAYRGSKSDPPILPTFVLSSLPQVFVKTEVGRIREDRELFGNEPIHACAHARAHVSPYIEKSSNPPKQTKANRQLSDLIRISSREDRRTILPGASLNLPRADHSETYISRSRKSVAFLQTKSGHRYCRRQRPAAGGRPGNGPTSFALEASVIAKPSVASVLALSSYQRRASLNIWLPQARADMAATRLDRGTTGLAATGNVSLAAAAHLKRYRPPMRLRADRSGD